MNALPWVLAIFAALIVPMVWSFREERRLAARRAAYWALVEEQEARRTADALDRITRRNA